MAFAHHLRVHAGQQGDGGRGVAEIMKCDFGQTRSTLQGVEVTGQASRMEGIPELVDEYILGQGVLAS